MFYCIRKFTVIGILALCLALAEPLTEVQAAGLQDTGEKLVIVIDPGHGGNNLGTTENGHKEKYMTMVTAQAMYDELILYENVEVYLTRNGDKSLTLEERAKFAASVDADFLFSIHYNASETHENFGSEAWVSLVSPYNAYGYQFGVEFLKNMREMGLLVRGVKTRVGDRGDYYGVIRESVALGIPAIILEHCHVDEERDEGYCSDDEKLAAFGKADATAVAKYFGLKSSALNVDYSGYELADVEEDVIAPFSRQDQTAPDVCQIEFVRADYEAGMLTLSVFAVDYDSTLLYYSYSLDGGETFSPREAWPESDALTGSYPDTIILDIDIPSGITPKVVVRAYNMYDFYSNSNSYNSTQVFYHNVPKGDAVAGAVAAALPTVEPEVESEFTKEIQDDIQNDIQDDLKNVLIIPVDAAVEETHVRSEFSLVNIILVCLISVVLLSVIVFIFQSILVRNREKHGH